MNNLSLSPAEMENEYDIKDRYELTDGRIVHVECETIKGMAGEPEDVTWFLIDGKPIAFRYIEPLLSSDDRVGIKMWLDEQGEGNAASAEMWTR